MSLIVPWISLTIPRRLVSTLVGRSPTITGTRRCRLSYATWRRFLDVSITQRTVPLGPPHTSAKLSVLLRTHNVPQRSISAQFIPVVKHIMSRQSILVLALGGTERTGITDSSIHRAGSKHRHNRDQYQSLLRPPPGEGTQGLPCGRSGHPPLRYLL